MTEDQREWNRIHSEGTSARSSIERELKQLSIQFDKIVEAIMAGMYHASMKTKMADLEVRKAELTAQLATLPEQDPIVLHPALLETYGLRIAALAVSLSEEPCRIDAAELP